MGALEVTPADEGRHTPDSEDLWGESWYLDFAGSDLSYGGYVRLGLYPNLGRSWLWVYLTGRERPLVALCDHALPCAAGDALEIAGNGSRVEIDTREPLARVHVAAGGTAARFDDAAGVFHGDRGTPVAAAIELDWHSRGPAFPYEATTRYEQSAWVTGRVTIGDETLAVDCPGQRDHSWGVRDWWLFPWNWTAGYLEDGTFFHAACSMLPGANLFQEGYVMSPGGDQQRVSVVECEVTLDDEQLPVRAHQRIGDLRFSSEPVGHAPVLLVADDRRVSRFPRAMCRFTTDDGRTGTGWTEYNWPERTARA
ncbi:MAG: hypothetical protein JOZ99_12185 [Actinobacteria bacterium]|nr:hypothetical protein [Actinomycetota bacterium]